MFCPICDAKIIPDQDYERAYKGGYIECKGYSEEKCPNGCYINHTQLGGNIEKFPKFNREFSFIGLDREQCIKVSEEFHAFVKINKIPLPKIKIVGSGSFGAFAKELLKDRFDIWNDRCSDDVESIILAVPISMYDECGAIYKDKHLINICSVQKPSTDILLKHTSRVTSIHPLFGQRTPENKRNSILTYQYDVISDDTWLLEGIESRFIEQFSKVSNIITGYTPDSHDRLMAKTHLVAVKAAQQAKILLEGTEDIPDEIIPNSFRLLRNFVKTLDDMPAGTLSSIKANPYS